MNMHGNAKPAAGDARDWSKGEQQDEKADGGNGKSPKPMFDVTPLAPLAVIVGVGIGVVVQSPDVRRACSDVLQDPAVRKVCREAATSVCSEIGASWRRHGGMTSLATTFLR